MLRASRTARPAEPAELPTRHVRRRLTPRGAHFQRGMFVAARCPFLSCFEGHAGHAVADSTPRLLQDAVHDGRAAARVPAACLATLKLSPLLRSTHVRCGASGAVSRPGAADCSACHAAAASTSAAVAVRGRGAVAPAVATESATTKPAAQPAAASTTTTEPATTASTAEPAAAASAASAAAAKAPAAAGAG